MNRTSSSLYLTYSNQAITIIERQLEHGLAARENPAPVPIFFRADDIGVPSPKFTRLLDCFSRHQVPLCPAIVPAWLTPLRWKALSNSCHQDSPLWCWHQHGWKHADHERTGKKNEFGPNRSVAAIKADLLRGKERLARIIGPLFTPIFTPPWNRCSKTTLKELAHLGFTGISRSHPAQPKAPALQELDINIDLHTRKETDAQQCLSGLADEFETAARSGRIGVMIHHQRMNDAAFELLEGLLALVNRSSALLPVHFKNLSDTSP